MKSLVTELQEKAMRSDTPINDLLRGAYVVSRKLKVKEFEKWLNYELNGYDAGINVPQYRRLTGEIRYLDVYSGGWGTFIYPDPSERNEFTTWPICNSLPHLYDLNRDENAYLSMPYPEKIRSFFSKSLGHETNFKVVFGKSQISNIIETVRTKILDWSLKLDEEGILGQNMDFTTQEIEKAQEIVQNQIIHIYGDVNGVLSLGNNSIIATNGSTIQINSNEELKSSLEKIAEELKNSNKNQEAINAVLELSKLIESNERKKIEENISKAVNNENSLKSTLKGLLLNASSSLAGSVFFEVAKPILGIS